MDTIANTSIQKPKAKEAKCNEKACKKRHPKHAVINNNVNWEKFVQENDFLKKDTNILKEKFKKLKRG